MPKTVRTARTKPAKKSAAVGKKRAVRRAQAGKLPEDRIAVAEPAGNLQARSAWFTKRRGAA